MKTISFLVLPILFIAFISCDETEDDIDIPLLSDVAGLSEATMTINADIVSEDIINTLESNDAISVVGIVDHQENAASVNLSLPYATTVLFGNPALGTPIMQENILAGLDLPQRIIVVNRGNGQNLVAFNSPDYLVNRYEVANASSLNTIRDALTNIVENNINSTVQENDALNTQAREGVVIQSSQNNFDSTYHLLKTALEAAEPVTIMAELDHQANAASVGMELPPAKILIFGNPQLGTKLMQDQITSAIDLPVKMLIFENEEGSVNVAWNDAMYLASRHGIDPNLDALNKINSALQNFADAATK